QQRLKSSFREPGFGKDLLNMQSTTENVGSVFQQTDVAGHERRRRKPEHLPERKIPGHHGQDDAKRVITYITFRRVRVYNLFRKERGGMCCIEFTGPRAFLHLG